MSHCGPDRHPGSLREVNRLPRRPRCRSSRSPYSQFSPPCSSRSPRQPLRAAAVTIPPATTTAAKVTRTLTKAGTCSAASHSKLKVKADDGRLETEFEVDQNRVGKRWRVTIKRNGSTVFRSIRTTQAPSGSFDGAPPPRRWGRQPDRRHGEVAAAAARPAAQRSPSELSQSPTRPETPPRLRPRRAQTRLSLGPERGLRSVGHADLLEDAGEVRLHGLLADPELARDQLVRQALRDAAQHLALALAQLGALARRRVR